ncbi:MAG TPA: S41 family peptidase [Chitinophagaceae bacterium]|nr:S41 family peptidase [Chitinophagaceae bacterium]
MKIFLRKGNICLLIGILISGLLFLGSCKKKNTGSNPSGSNNGGKTNLTNEDSLKYLMYHIMQVSFVNGGRDSTYQLPTYYWNSAIPTLNPLNSIYANADSLLSTMKAFAMNPLTGLPYDHYSFLDRTGAVANQLQNGQENNFGMQVTYALDINNNSYLYVLYADKNSPAGLAGITRGWQITAVNGNSNISYDGPSGTNTNTVVNAVYNSPTSSFTFLKPDNTSTTITLNTATYNLNPILFDSVYTISGKQVGYFVFYTFSSVYDSAGNATLTQGVLNNEFAKFEAAGVKDVIVDLRYNGGGDVLTSQYIDSLLAPSSVAGKVMYNYYYNSALTTNEANLGLPSQVLFTGGGSLNLDNVFFIVSRSTASASELTLNNLKPYMNIKLVGDTTYGKPVGFFDFPVSDYDSSGNLQYLADLYAIDYETKNSLGQGGYYSGIAPDQEAIDYVNVPWGDTADDNLVKIFNYISTGSFARTSGARLVNPENERRNLIQSMPNTQFNGMVDFRSGKKLESKWLTMFRRKQ